MDRYFEESDVRLWQALDDAGLQSTAGQSANQGDRPENAARAAARHYFSTCQPAVSMEPATLGGP